MNKDETHCLRVLTLPRPAPDVDLRTLLEDGSEVLDWVTENEVPQTATLITFMILVASIVGAYYVDMAHVAYAMAVFTVGFWVHMANDFKTQKSWAVAIKSIVQPLLNLEPSRYGDEHLKVLHDLHYFKRAHLCQD